jgi:DNA uptake protein ComE-like DNA-binding protein
MEHRVRSRQAGRFAALDEQKAEGRAARDMALDINTAQLPRLKSLTGIGEHYAMKIVAGRPYRDREELLTRQILPYHIYGRIMERLRASEA